MKTLQNNFTTPEQSKRLLKLGLPADSADMLYFATENSKENYNRGIFYETPVVLRRDNILHEPTTNTFPCWSVGRLMDIELICREQIEGMVPRLIFTRETTWAPASGRDMLETIINFMEKGGFKYDFSKLED